MTIYVNETFEKVASNNIDITGPNNIVSFILTSGFSKTDTVLPAEIIFQNSRYTELEVQFPTTFKDEHKNGIYYYTIQNDDTIFEKGYCKIVTEPGGSNGAVAYDSGIQTEERQSVVYYRPNY